MVGTLSNSARNVAPNHGPFSALLFPLFYSVNIIIWLIVLTKLFLNCRVKCI
jgi:hypothetical protein